MNKNREQSAAAKNSAANKLLNGNERGTEEKDFSTGYIYVPKKKPFNKKIPITLILIIITSWALYKNYLILFKSRTIQTEDAMTELQIDRSICDQLSNYVYYIFNKYQLRGFDALAEKWAKNVPDYFKNKARKRIKKLEGKDEEFSELSGFTVQKVFGNRKNIFTVQCMTNTVSEEIVFIDVTREKINDKMVFRLYRIY